MARVIETTLPGKEAPPPSPRNTRRSRWNAVIAKVFTRRRAKFEAMPMSRWTAVTVLSLVVAAVSACDTLTGGPGLETGIYDQRFADFATESGLAEVEAGRLAASRAQSGEVRDFANRMVEEHSRADEDLNGLLDRKGIQTAAGISPEHRQMIDRLAQLSGQAFDREYIAGQVADHREAVARYRRQTIEGEDRDIRELAKRSLPQLEQHLAMAQALASR
jgi:putative membrane protein